MKDTRKQGERHHDNMKMDLTEQLMRRWTNSK